MGKKLPYTPTSQIKNHLRMLWLRSRERNAAIKREKGCCQKCGKKQSKRKGAVVKIEVHHIRGIKWKEIIEPGDLSAHKRVCLKCGRLERGLG